MAKKKSSNNTGPILMGIILVCIVAVLSIAAFSETSRNDGPTVEGTDVTSSVTDTSTGTQTVLPTEPTDTAGTSSVTDTDPVTCPTSDTDTDTDTNTDTGTDTGSGTATGTDHGYISANKTDSFDKDLWYMLLANPTTPLPENFTFQQATVYSAGRNWIMDARCAEDMKAMLAAAKSDGVDLIICSAYRNIETQTNNFNAKVREYMAKGYSEEEAKKVTATIIAVPGTSEHHTGMAADIVTPSYQRLNAGFDQTEAYRWLEANCAEFGFVLRYRKDKTEITKIIYEPWHYRYVGREAATIMMEEKICFEEFLEKYGT